MIKARGVINGRPVFMVGLSDGNFKNFKKDNDNYIVIRAEEYGLSHDLLIFYRDTEKELMAAILPLTGQDTKVNITDEAKELLKK